MPSKPLQRSLIELRKQGYTVGVTERWNPFAHIRQDLYGFIDALAFHPERNEILAVQACADNGGDVSDHVKKLVLLDEVKAWIAQPARRLEIWGWGKRGARGKRKVWTLRIIPMTQELFV